MEKKDELVLTFYHVGLVKEVVPGKEPKDRKVVVEMWDQNLVICPAGVLKAESGSYVIVKFDGIVQGQNILMHPNVVSDVLEKENGERIWDMYKDFYSRVKPSHPLTG
ncbi:MAG: hypothetical protein OH316_02230 [Candidatus Parvarchaeota archaeon]|nr:hypothetical protein [Candidatus Parvarchaeota archaeon]